MRINEILVESTLEEGPILNKIGSGIGKAAGTVAKGVGAVAGGIAGIPGAVKKGFQAGKSTVAGGGDTDAGGQAAAPAASGGTAPAAGTSAAPAAKQPGLLQKIGQTAGDFKKGFQQGAGQPAAPAAQAPAAQATAAQAPAPTANTQAPAQAPAAGAQQPAAPTGTAYAQVKAGVDKLDKKGKQRILQALQKEVGTPAAKPAAAAPATTPEPAGLQAGGSAQGQSTAPADPNANAAPPEPGDQRWYNDRVGQWGWKGASGGWSGDEQDIAPAVKPRTKKPVNISGRKKTVQPQQQVASKEPKGNMVAEGFSIFRKR